MQASCLSKAAIRSFPPRSLSAGREAMQDSQQTFLMLLMVSWGVVTSVLIILVIYRGVLSSREDDQIFIDAAEQHLFQEQQAVIAKMSRLTKPIIALAVISGILLLTSAGIWIYGGLKSRSEERRVGEEV